MCCHRGRRGWRRDQGRMQGLLHRRRHTGVACISPHPALSPLGVYAGCDLRCCCRHRGQAGVVARVAPCPTLSLPEVHGHGGCELRWQGLHPHVVEAVAVRRTQGGAAHITPSNCRAGRRHSQSSGLSSWLWPPLGSWSPRRSRRCIVVVIAAVVVFVASSWSPSRCCYCRLAVVVVVVVVTTVAIVVVTTSLRLSRRRFHHRRSWPRGRTVQASSCVGVN